MKTVFNIVIFLVIVTFTTSVVYMYSTRTSCEVLVQKDTEDGSDTDDVPVNTTEEEEEECEIRFKELFCEGISPILLGPGMTTTVASFGDPAGFREFHLTNPPFSPPELM